MTTAVLFQNMPPLSPEEYAALEASILEHGIQSPVIMDDEGVIIDGHHRSKIASEHSLTVPKQVVHGKTEAEKRTLALSLNLDRRHLNREQRRALIAESVKADPSLSDLAHAKRTGASDKTVTSVRRDLEARSEIPNVAERTDSLGRTQPASKPERPIPTFDATPDWDPVDVDHNTGEIQPRPEPKDAPKPQRRPLPDQFRDASYDLRKITERLEKLVADDRFPRNREQVALIHQSDLSRASNALAKVIDALNNN